MAKKSATKAGPKAPPPTSAVAASLPPATPAPAATPVPAPAPSPAPSGAAARLARYASAPAKKGIPSATLPVTVDKVVNGQPAKVDAVQLYLEAMAREKDAAREMEDLFEVISAAAEAERIRLSRAAGKLETSLKINNRLTFTQPHGYRGVPLASEAQIRAIFAAAYDGYYKVKNEVKVKSEVEIDDDMVTALEALCAKKGKKFEEVFDVKQVIAPNEQLTNDRVMRPDVEALFAQAKQAGLVVPKKATLKE
jgi:hypothetical protein